MKRQRRHIPDRAGIVKPGRGNDDSITGRRRKSAAMGMFPSIKMARMVSYTSPIEMDLLYVLDFHPQVLEFKERPFSFEYSHISECRKVAYTPDFAVRTPERTLLIECLSSRQLDTKSTQERFAALRLWSASNTYCMAFAYVSERELRTGCYLSNVKLLTHHSRHEVDARTKATIYAILDQAPFELTVGQVALRLSPASPADAIPDILHMAYKGEVYVPLHDWVVTGESPICLPYQLPKSLVPLPNHSTDIPALGFLNANERGR